MGTPRAGTSCVLHHRRDRTEDVDHPLRDRGSGGPRPGEHLPGAALPGPILMGGHHRLGPGVYQPGSELRRSAGTRVPAFCAQAGPRSMAWGTWGFLCGPGGARRLQQEAPGGQADLPSPGFHGERPGRTPGGDLGKRHLPGASCPDGGGVLLRRPGRSLEAGTLRQ